MAEPDDHHAADHLASWRRTLDRFHIPPFAFSANGRMVSIRGPLTLGLNVGGFAVVDVEGSGECLVLHVLEMDVEERGGPSVGLDRDEADEALGQTTFEVRIRGIAGLGAVIGRFDSDRFVAEGAVSPFGESPVRPATEDEVRLVLDTLDGSSPTIDIGRLRDFPELPARVRSKGFSRHTFMCGQSGSGKTYTTGVLFERLLVGSTLPVLVLDPNSDHVHLDSLADPDDRRAAAVRYRTVAGEVTTFRARGHGGTSTLCADFSDLVPTVRAQLLRLDPIRDLDDYHALETITGGLAEPFSVADVATAAAASETTAPIARRIANLGLADWGIWRRDGERSVAGDGVRRDRFMVVDTGSLSTPTERTLLALAILGRRWRTRRERRPVLIAIDEAHNVLPASTSDPLLRSASEYGALIAGEGRKFGIHLFLASQRPGKLHPNVLSQCDNLVLMRLNGAGDVADLETAFSHVPPMLLRESLAFGLGQALVAGPLAPLPFIAQVGMRLTAEGGADVPTTWTEPPEFD